MKRLIILVTITFACFTGFSKEKTVNNIYDCIVENKVYEPAYVLAQSMLETGWLSSYNCKHRNNLFGFRSRSWITEGNSNGYKVFDTWEESVEYYQRWQLRKGYIVGENYIAFLKRVGYAEDPEYSWKVKSVLKRLRNQYNIK